MADPKANVEIARELYDRWNARDFDRLAELMANDGEIVLVGSDTRFRGPGRSCGDNYRETPQPLAAPDRLADCRRFDRRIVGRGRVLDGKIAARSTSRGAVEAGRRNPPVRQPLRSERPGLAA